MKRMNNSGMSLVELIVVLAIVSVVGTGLVIGVNATSGKAAEECAAKLESAFAGTRTTALGKIGASGTVRVETDGIWYIETIESAGPSGVETSEKKTRIGDDTVSVKYKITGKTEYIDLLSGNELRLKFNRSNGSFGDLSYMGSAQTGKYAEEIVVSKAGKEYRLALYHLTGKAVME